MKKRKNSFILVVVIGILCISAPADVEMPLPTEELDKPFLIGRAYPELADIKGVYFNIVKPKVPAGKDNFAWKELKDAVRSRLTEAGIEMIVSKVDNEHDIGCPQLRADVDMLKLEDSNQCILRIQTSLARIVYLTKNSSWLIKADVWKAQPVMLAASVQDMPSVVTNSILQQTDAFISAYHVANSQPVRPNDVNATSETLQKALSETPSELLAVENEFVASKNSGIFHKPDCRWAKNISPSNLVSYRNMEEAIKDGKKPCGTCRP
jgi:hypothetical protein